MVSYKDFKRIGKWYLDTSNSSTETGYKALLFDGTRLAKLIKISNNPHDAFKSRIIGDLKYVSLPSLGDIDMWYGTRKEENGFPGYFLLKDGKYYGSISSGFAFLRHDKEGNVVDIADEDIERICTLNDVHKEISDLGDYSLRRIIIE